MVDPCYYTFRSKYIKCTIAGGNCNANCFGWYLNVGSPNVTDVPLWWDILMIGGGFEFGGQG